MSLAFLAGALLGSLPVAYWFGLLRGQDLLRTGRPGGLEALPLLGPIPGGMVLLLETGLGAMAVALGEGVAQDPLGGLLGGLGAVLGAVYSPWLLFRGGSGLGVALGVVLAVEPRALLFAGIAYLLSRPFGLQGLALPLALLGLALGLGVLKGPPFLLFGLGLGGVLALAWLRKG